MRIRTRLLPVAIVALLAACSPPAAVSTTLPPPASAAAAPAPGGEPEGAAAATAAGAAAAKPEAILERADLAAYHGWIRYLMFRSEHADERFGAGSEAARHDHAELATWTERVLDDPALLSKLRGVVEWAYISPVDGSGQPFKLNIPTDYDPAHPAPLALYMHGYSGNHLEHSGFMKEQAGGFEVAVLGRSRGGRYRALSEADVLDVLDYIEAHWAIDASRVHLRGGSMGGGGTFWLGSRYPQRFASGRPVCGFASDLPIGNLLTFPIYATHSDDDFTVPVLHSRGPIQLLKKLGGNATLDETTGLGHAAWDYKEGNARGDAWYPKQVLPSSHDVRRLSFTALDGRALRDYWAEVTEWGPKPEPASLTLEVGAKNKVTARLHNVARWSIRVNEAPLDPKAALELSIDGARLVHPAPLGEHLTLVSKNGAWSFEDTAPTPPALAFRLHTPGGANQLYDGEPLLIVYGTAGGADVATALKNAAIVASHSANAAWPSPNGEEGDDGVSHNQNTYGDLKIAADVDVSDEQLKTHHLVLIGTATQNRLVARMAEKLPVRYEPNEIRFSDGSREPAPGNALGLVHYNPLAPSRLVFWVASNDTAYYRADALIPQVLGSFPTGADLVIARVSEPRLVMARSFDSRWSWVSREGSPVLPAPASDRTVFADLLAETARKAAKADFALALEAAETGPTYAGGSIRLSDLTALAYYEPIGVLTLTGAELAQARLALVARPGAHFVPEPSPSLDPKRKYRLAVTARQISPLVFTTHLAPKSYELTQLDIAAALGSSGFTTR